ncbi:MAG TPA: UDP-N-acetylmuramoyl-tripeptide--D-alanyl-D-alanine ligase, partial [Phycisphaerae bacterium]|nr:UDP-N-acetylmuramoyl-tripeptide--D-alanyl-D-alanine ligase [Phycisphaerae bacterium]
HSYAQELLNSFKAGVIAVQNSREALLDLGGFYRSVLAAVVIGVTGSNGKTTVKRMIEHILKKKFNGTCSPKSFNNEIGVPLTILGAGAGDDFLICEMGTSAPGEIARLTKAVKPNIAVITSIYPAHLQRLESLDRIAMEKAALLGYLKPQDIAVITSDSPELDHAVRPYNCRFIRFGTSESAHLRLTDYQSDSHHQRFQINQRDWVELPLPGRHNALNAIAAIAVSARMGFTQQEAAEALADFTGVEMRLQDEKIGPLRVINDAYNANPGSMIAAAAVLAECDGRKVFIAGDMKELGPQSEDLHMQIGREIGLRRPGLVIGVGELGTLLAKGAAKMGTETHCFPSVEEAVKEIPALLCDGDTILIKGSRAMGMERLIDSIRKKFE